MKQWLKAFNYTPKRTRLTDENILRLLFPSFMGILLCMVCLVGSTWAWFTSSIQSGLQTITAAHFAIEVNITAETAIETTTEGAAGDTIEGDASGNEVQKNNTLSVLPNENNSYSLTQGTVYTVTLTATGTAPSGGYCTVEGGGETLYTAALIPGDKLTFTLIPATDGEYTFTAVWGSHNGAADIENDDTIGQLPEPSETPEDPGSEVPEPPEVPEQPETPEPSEPSEEPPPPGTEDPGPQEDPEPPETAN